MKTSRLLSCLLGGTLLISSLVAAQNENELVPSLPDAKVTIPYSELKSLWEAARSKKAPAPEPAPPIASTVLAAEYHLTLDSPAPTLEASYQVQSLSDDWSLLPLLGGEAHLEQGPVEGQSVIWTSDAYHLLTRSRGNEVLALKFALPMPAEWKEGLELKPGPAALNRLRVTGIPAGQVLRIDGLTPTRQDDQESVFHIPGGTERLSLHLEVFRKPEAPVVTPPQASTWVLQSEVHLDYREGRLSYQCLKKTLQSKRLPEWLREKVGPRAFLTAEAGETYALKANWLPRLQTAQAMVAEASYESRLVADGALLVKASYIISHQAPMSWRLELPKIDEVLTCKVNATAVQPVKRGEGILEFSLPQPTESTTTVSLCYAARLDPFDQVSGRCDLELPRTDLFIHDLKWDLQLPDEYRTTALEGNVAIDRRNHQSQSDSILHLRKELVRGEHPALELYYQRRGLDN